MIEPYHQPSAHAMMAGTHRADRVIVAGKWVAEDGAIPGLNRPALKARQDAAAAALHATE
jgi:8-oxoguanine deaminase